jgi:hypothetical protein
MDVPRVVAASRKTGSTPLLEAQKTHTLRISFGEEEVMNEFVKRAAGLRRNSFSLANCDRLRVAERGSPAAIQ